MRFFSEMRVGTKLIAAFLTVALVGAIIGAVGIYSLSRVSKTADNMYRYETLGMHYAAEAKSDIIAVRGALRNMFVSSTEPERLAAIKNMNNLFDSVYANLALARDSFSTQEGKAYLDSVSRIAQEYQASLDAVVARVDEQPYLEPSPLVGQILSQVVPIATELDKEVNAIISSKAQYAHDYNEEITRDFISVRNGLLFITAFGALIAMVLGFFLTRGLIRQLGGEPAEVSTIANAISHGNLHSYIDLAKAREGSVMHSMDEMQTALRQTVLDVRDSSDAIAAGSFQIAAGNRDLSQRTEEQAANVTETASAMEEITSTLRSNADAAREATQLANVVRSSASDGQAVVQDVVTSMQEMRSSSEQIASIINVIDGIAFQTNILALNAAVEAARAGSEGRGFAVVASEVRTLAQRSAAAAQDIKKLIEESVNKVSEGNQKVTLAGTTIASMVEQVNQVATLIDEISSATLEQNAGVEQVTQAIGQLEEVTQQNSALVEQSAVAAAALNDQAARLVNVVRVFDLGEGLETPSSPSHKLSANPHLLR